jgi:glucan phosphoethanolaminetransferase (alkaline phosphatase superfamily)
MGLVYDPNAIKIIESYFLLLLYGFMLPIKLNKPSNFFSIFLFAMTTVPLSSVYSLKNQERMYFYLVLLSLLMILIISRLPEFKLRTVVHGRLIAIIVGFILFIGIFSWIGYKGGFSYFNLNLLRVYEFRRVVGSQVFYGIFGYFMSWYGKVINPMFIAYFLWKRSYSGFVFFV